MLSKIERIGKNFALYNYLLSLTANCFWMKALTPCFASIQIQ